MAAARPIENRWPWSRRNAIGIAKPAIPAMPRFRFENFTTANGLPDNHVFACWWMAIASGPGPRTVSHSTKTGSGRPTQPRMGWRIAR